MPPVTGTPSGVPAPASPPAVEPSVTAPATTPSPSIQSVPTAQAAYPTTGPIGVEHERLGGNAGPLGPAVAEQQCGLALGGCLQEFTNGLIAWSETTGAKAVRGPILTVWRTLGGVNGYLGYPAGDLQCGLPNGACQQKFQRGYVFDVPGVGTYPVWGGINGRYQLAGGIAGYLGYPLGVEQCGLQDGVCQQKFQRGYIYYVPGVGTFSTRGAIHVRHQALGGIAGYLGPPHSEEQCGLPNGACQQKYQRGYIYYVPDVGTYPVWGAINGRYQSHNGIFGYLGYPKSDEQCGLRYGGCVQSFQRGKIYFAIGAGTEAVWGGLGAFYDSRRAQNSALGYPITGEACDAAGNCSQSFQFGQLQWINGGGVRYRVATAGYCPALNAGAVKYPGAGAQRVSFAIADSYRSTAISMITCVRQPDGQYTKEWGALGSAGESGFAGPGVATGPTWQKYSPTGSYSVTEAFGLGNPGTALSYRTLNPYSRWGGQLNANYNKYFESSADIFPDENMWYYATRPSRDYRQGVVINYNRPPDSPIVMNAGFAIFLHGNNVPTWGCIALNDGDLLQYMRTAQPGDRFVMGVAYDIFH